MMRPSFGLRQARFFANAMLGNKVVVQGHIRSQEDLIIEGEVEGTIEMMEHRLTIAANGKIRADVKAREFEVLGSIHGKIEAWRKYISHRARSIFSPWSFWTARRSLSDFRAVLFLKTAA
jgi:hypothetical protein